MARFLTRGRKDTSTLTHIECNQGHTQGVGRAAGLQVLEKRNLKETQIL
jgi:hypothetical protein